MGRVRKRTTHAHTTHAITTFTYTHSLMLEIITSDSGCCHTLRHSQTQFLFLQRKRRTVSSMASMRVRSSACPMLLCAPQQHKSSKRRAVCEGMTNSQEWRSETLCHRIVQQIHGGWGIQSEGEEEWRGMIGTLRHASNAAHVFIVCGVCLLPPHTNQSRVRGDFERLIC